MMARPLCITRTLLLTATLLAAGVMTTSCSVTVPVNLVAGFTVPNTGGLIPGDPFPADFKTTPIPICSELPSAADLQALLQQQLGPIGALLRLSTAELVDATFTAASGDFSDVTAFELVWQPTPLNGDDQTPVSLGRAASESGLSSPAVLTPDAPVDFLALINAEADNAPGDCPTLYARIAGTVPSPMPAWDVQMRLRITGKL